MAQQQKMPYKNLIIIMAVIIGAFLILRPSGPGLPKELKTKAKAIPVVIKNAQAQVEKNQSDFKTLDKFKEFSTIAPIAQKESWNNHFASASQNLEKTKQLYKERLTPLIKANRPEDAQQVKEQINRLESDISKAIAMSKKPKKRFSAIRAAIKNTAAYAQQAQTDAKQIKTIIDDLEKGSIAKAHTDFPDLTDKIDKRFAPAAQIRKDTKVDAEKLAILFGAYQAGKTIDWAAFTDHHTAVENGLKQTMALERKINSQVGQLYTSYTKILKDMKAEYEVTIKRESWDENSDFNDSSIVSFTRKVSPEAYETLLADKVGTIATISPGFTGPRFSSHVGNAWKALGIKPGENWPSNRHNAATFWVESSKEAFFHKYILEKEGQTSETGWQPVSANVYDSNIEYLGMAILAKPYGTFEEDQDTQAAPPGMAYVGNEKYGEWKEDEKGDRFWSWYGRYAFFSNLFFFPPSYYYYSSWYGWHNNYRYRRPYFGSTGSGFKKYGTYGTYIKKSPNFQNSSFVKSGGLKSPPSSVRGASAGLRGGGPKSKGK